MRNRLITGNVILLALSTVNEPLELSESRSLSKDPLRLSYNHQTDEIFDSVATCERLQEQLRGKLISLSL